MFNPRVGIIALFVVLATMRTAWSFDLVVVNPALDSLEHALNSKLPRAERLNTLHQLCKILYGNDSDQELLRTYAEEGIAIAQDLNLHERGSDLAVWILRANIFLRSNSNNSKYYTYLKKLYEEGHIDKQKYIHPLYSEIYSYIDYGRMKDAEAKMEELEQLVDHEDPKQLTYYLDPYIAFKRKSKEYKAASEALEKFADTATEIEDPRFNVIALSRNAEFYLEDSINYNVSLSYAQRAMEIVKKEELSQYHQSILLQISQAYYNLNNKQEFERHFSQIELDSIASDNNIFKKDYFTFTADLNYNQKKYKEASQNYIKAVQFLELSDFVSMEKLIKKIERSYVKQNDYKSAFKYANRLNVLKDSLYNEENIKALNYFESKLRFKDAETEKLKLKNKIFDQRKNTLYLGLITGLLLLGLLLYNRILDDRVKIRTAALDEKNQELEESLEELEQFNYIASHDIKEPMRVVSSITGLIEKKLIKENNTKFESEFGLVKSSIQQLYNLIEDLSQFLAFKSKAITYQLIDTNTITCQVNRMLTNMIETKEAEVNFSNLPEIYSSSALLTVIFKNFIENGLKYNKSSSPKVVVTYKDIGNQHEFSFKDNGIGIDKKYHEYIFQMFKRLENKAEEGSGLGLGLVSKAVEKLNGKIHIDSKEGQGSTFRLVLPKEYEA